MLFDTIKKKRSPVSAQDDLETPSPDWLCAPYLGALHTRGKDCFYTLSSKLCVQLEGIWD